MSSGRWRLLRSLLGIAVLAFGVYTLTQSWDSARARLLPHPLVLVSALGLAVMGAWAGARSWAALLGEPGYMGRLVRVFLAVQLAKYLPLGTAAHALGMVTLSAGGGRTRTQVMGGFVLHLGIVLAAAFAIGSLCAYRLIPKFPLIAASLCLLPVIGYALLTPLARAALALGRRLLPATASMEAYTVGDVRRSLHCALITQIVAGTSFSLLLNGGLEWADLPSHIGAFSWAWAAGFLALPFPAGVGVRELVLVALLPQFALADIVAASIAHRCAIITAEVLLAAPALHDVTHRAAEEVR